MAKRSASEGSSGTPAKRPSLLGVDIGPVSGQDELDLKVGQVCALIRNKFITWFRSSE